MSRSEKMGYDFVMVLLSVSLIVMGILLYILCRRKRPAQQESEETLSAPVKSSAYACPLADIDAATDGFKQNRVVGQGRLGTVYAGIFPKGELAVKRIHSRFVLGNAGVGFASVIKPLSLAQHPNIVPILAFSQAPGERIMVTEFVGIGSLEFYLHQNPDGASLLDWSRRLRFAAGAARGLEYLHEEMTPNIIHGCVKSSNILLDVKFCARVCDYGLSFLAPKEKKGLAGHVDDEYWINNSGNGACKESDVYGFGVVLLELLCGRRSEEGLLLKWALPLIKEMKFSEVLDPRIPMPTDKKPIVRLAKVASACVSNNRKNRPSIVQVAAILNSVEIEVSE